MVKIARIPDKELVAVLSPYNPEFPRKARNLGGKWDPSTKTWVFDARDEDRVRDLCLDVYGCDGRPTETVTVRYTVDSVDADSDAELYVCGRQVARKHGRDSAPRLGDGVVIVSGGFPTRSGSAKYPTLGGEGTVLEIRDIPKAHAEKEDLQIVDSRVDLEALKAEKTRLLARLEEINSLLG